ncbi:MAG: diacylglycerol kinase family lipid kinase [Phaeodactylibacter sp.]|nr:diacylglycerol kinase family lipid kinase [Phaeodactylibacter sp.]MCB9267335.1 diacylglycerol kinase family lipid kinase [Lewinellaceae bacterium]MCB9289357.1 diacylglycerol kinase family lipid kinase [Lewinellaceae bacterium]
MRKLLFVINPIAGDTDKGLALAEIEQFCSERGWNSQVLKTTGQDDAARIEQAMSDFSPDTVVAGGGDGTVNLVARLLLGKDCRLGVLPLGSANGLATELGISKNVPEALDVLHSGKVVEMDALLVNGEHYCFHLADIGYNAKLIQSFEEEGQRGQLGYARQFLRTMRERPVNRYHIEAGGRRFKQVAVMITFANARRYGTGAVINPKGQMDDGRFEVCIFHPWPRWYLLWLGFLFFIGRLEESRYVKILSVREVQVSSSGPLPLQVDGELLGERREVQVEMAEEKVGVWAPVESGKRRI